MYLKAGNGMNYKVDFPIEDDCRKIYQLNFETFGGELTIDYEYVKEWYDTNPYQWLVAKDEEDNLLGYINFSHIKNETFDNIINGTISEKDVRSNDIIKLGEKENIFCYIQGFVVRDKNTRVAISLLNKVLSYFRFLKGKGIIIEKVGTMAVTGDGSRLCEKLGFRIMKEIKMPDGLKETIYLLDLSHTNYSIIIKGVKDIFLDTRDYLE